MESLDILKDNIQLNSDESDDSESCYDEED